MIAARAWYASLGGNRKGILWVLIASLLFAWVNVLGKLLSLTYPLTEVVWLRFVFHAVLIFLVLGRRLPARMRARHLKGQIARSTSLFLCTILYFAGARLMPLAEVTAMMFLGPILVAALSGLVLKEPVASGRWLGIMGGFAGVLLIIRPGGDFFGWTVILPLAAAMFLALDHLASRVVGRVDAPVTTAAYSPLVGAAFTTLAMPFVWVMPDAEGWLLMVLMGVFGGAGQFAFVKAFQLAEASVASPFFYAVLVWTAAVAFVVFGEIPDAWTWAGAMFMVASGIHLARRERPRAEGVDRTGAAS